jgi:ATP-binding cassette, subfamily C (CFTR/MRP), member 1
VIVLLVFSQYLGAAVPVAAAALYLLQRFYLRTSRQVRLLGIEARAPLYAHFSESVAGGPVLRAFGWQAAYRERACALVDAAQRPAYAQACLQHWLGLMLDLLVAALATVLVATVVATRARFSAGAVGVSLVMVIGFGSTLARLVRSWTRLESSIGAVSRVKRFVEETPREEEGSREMPPPDWPQSGALKFENLTAAYG